MKLASFRTAAFLVFAAVVAVPAVAEHAKLLKRHGVVYGVRDFAYQRGCKGVPRGDACEVYKMSGTIVSVRRDPDTRRTTSFMLRMPNGRTQLQNLDVAHFPVAADHLIRQGRRVHVSGSMSGQGRVAAPDEIVVETRR
jgi:hypothetical protein